MKLLNGKFISENLNEQMKLMVREGKWNPCLVVITAGADIGNSVYVRSKRKACELIGIKFIHDIITNNHTTQDVIDLIETYNIDDDVDGIIVQLPIYNHLDVNRIINAINPQKDVDGFTYNNLGRMLSNKPQLQGCTPKGIIKLLDAYGINIKGKHVVVIGRSLEVGKPIANMMINKDATVTVCHSKTINLRRHTEQADILIVAIGKPKFITHDMIKPNCIIIDVGINRDENGKLCGDVDFDSCSTVASYITPVPGGVGPMTVSMLMQNTLMAYTRKICTKCFDVF